MCIAIPMQVTRTEPGHAWVIGNGNDDSGRGEEQRVNTALVGERAVGDWVLVFLGSAREHIDAERAAEVNALLDLIRQPEARQRDHAIDLGFDLPSAMSAEQLSAFNGQQSR
jgi:hydrogenase expression/formation protein HypC